MRRGTPIRRGTTIAWGLLAVAAPIVAWRVLLSPEGVGERGGPEPTIVVETIPRLTGVTGAPRAVSAAGDVLAACFDDGSLVVRRGAVVVRTRPPGDEEFRRVAVLDDGRAVVLSQRGRLHVVLDGVATASPTRVQAGSRMVAHPGTASVWIAGEAGRLVRLDLASGSGSILPYESGEAPASALAASASRGFVGRVDGVVRSATILDGKTAEVLTFPTGVSALDAAGPWLAAGNERGEVRTRHVKTTPSGASATVAGRVVALALPPRGAEGALAPEPLLVVHEPATATVLWSGLERRVSVSLAGKPLCGCALPSGGGLYVGLESGEEVLVRVRGAGR